MSAKLLMGLSEENPELERQIGCMTGIFQVFDRHHRITGRRFSGQNHKRLTSGHSQLSSNTYTEEHNPGSPQIVREHNRNKSSKENQKIPVESSASISSSPSTSYSASQTKPICNDFRDVIKDSINGEFRVLSVKTSVKDEIKKDKVLKYRDSPRPIMSVDMNDSIQVLTRLREAPRFSCDGREMTRSKSITKLRELPRLSLDSRESSLQSSNFSRSSLNQGIPSVVAKLMGLDALPSSESQEPTKLARTNTEKYSGEGEKERISKHSYQQTESVYSQIDRRAKELEFSHSNKDLRALKHILDTMQAKGILGSKETESQQSKNLKPTDSQKFESPIVIMKPAKSIKRSEGLEGLKKVQTSDPATRKKAKDQTPKEKKTEESNSQKIRAPLMQRSPRRQQPSRERSESPVKSSGSSSPRVQQRKIEPEKKPRALTRKKKAERKPFEPLLQNRNLRVKSQIQMDDNQGKKSAEICQREHGDISSATMIINSPSCEKDNEMIQNEDTSSIDSAIVSVEQPSPNSVLEAAFYQDDLPLSPMNKISCTNEDNDKMISMNLANAITSKLSSEIHLQKRCVIKNLVNDLSQISPTDDDCDHVFQILMSAGIQENTPQPKSNADKLHQDLIFDIIKEILVQKLELMIHGPQIDLFNRAKKINSQYLWTELCSEIKQVLVKRPTSMNVEEEDLRFRKDLLIQTSCGWEDLGIEVPGIVLDIERSIFKDLIDEIVTSEACSSLQVKGARRRRKLYV
ncbi:uncharacterized protein A4U43_C03F27070 [Asparagus officinalis]|uniref:DUF4378 domain-containing protein n=1 Tax=Asparagus officinalis TaxID=4686 RepID=A0A5P1FHK7_ASPOF|nr:protein LONGIFOLIA 1-like [Asparagus officinalis]ONK76379.1 uncharacterized protein A4U43_C03F27070 [Asparagus officinalis]